MHTEPLLKMQNYQKRKTNYEILRCARNRHSSLLPRLQPLHRKYRIRFEGNLESLEDLERGKSENSIDRGLPGLVGGKSGFNVPENESLDCRLR